MKRIWAPWRIDYILNTKPTGCVFCIKEQRDMDRENLVLHRTALSFVMLNRYPYSNGHLLVAPYRHLPGLNDLSVEEMGDLFELVRLSSTILTAASAPQGFNIGINLGKAAGAGVAEHLHVHIVPRWNGDTNFMSVVADLRVLPEQLLATYDRLLPKFCAALNGAGASGPGAMV